MLHAELHNKIGPDSTDGQRREDVLTSTAFGTIFVAGATSLLRQWLRKARDSNDAALEIPSVSDEPAYWFWPWLDQTEPDVVIELGNLLVVVEVKYWAGASGDDQLLEQWRVCGKPAKRTYEASIGAAIDRAADRVVVYLVQRKKLARARKHVRDSLAICPDARIFLLTWEDLDDVLSTTTSRWARELRAFLAMRGLSAFHGFAKTFAHTALARLDSLVQWRAHRWQALLPRDSLLRLSRLRTWAPFTSRKGLR